MARTARPATAPDTAPAAADGAPGTAPGTDAPETGTSPAAAVMTALTALGADGAAVTDIARNAGLPVADTRKALIGYENAGTATREKGARPGKPDIWRAAPAPQDRDDEQPAGPEEPEDSEETPASTADDAPVSQPAPGDEPASPAETDGTVPPDPGDDDSAEPAEPEETVTAESAEDSSGTDEDQPDEDQPDEDQSEENGPDEPPAEPGPAGEQDAPAPDGGEGAADGEPADGAGDPPDPAAIAEASEQALKIAQAVADIGTALVAGQISDALDAIEAIRDPAAQARRVLKAATRKRGSGTARGTRAPQPRAGALRELVEAHLYKFPEAEFTPHEIAKVLVRSSGAVANALDRLTELGVAEMTNEKPRRFRLRADAPARPGLTDGASEPGTEADPGADAGPAPEAEPATAPGAEAESVPEPEAAPGPAPAQAPDTGAEAEAEADEPERADADAEAAITAGAA